MAKVKAREVLGVNKNGPDYGWFHLAVNGLPTLSVGNENAVWQIDERVVRTVAYVQKKWEHYDYGENNKGRHLIVKRVRIVGPREQIKNLLYNIGQGLPEEAIGPRWKEN